MEKKTRNIGILVLVILITLGVLYWVNLVNYYSIERNGHIETITDKFGKIHIDYANNLIFQNGIVIAKIDSSVIRKNGKIIKK